MPGETEHLKGDCDTCGVKDVYLFVYALPGIPMSVGNCRVCFEVSAYPWGILVANTAMIGGMEHAADWWKEEVRVSLARHGKTRAEFMEAVAADMKAMELMEDPQKGGGDGEGQRE